MERARQSLDYIEEVSAFYLGAKTAPEPMKDILTESGMETER